MSLLLYLALLLAAASACEVMVPCKLTVEGEEAPNAVDVDAPRFSWITMHDERGARQSAFRIRVWDAANTNNVLWDTQRCVGWGASFAWLA